MESQWPSSASWTDNQQHSQTLLPPYSCRLQQHRDWRSSVWSVARSPGPSSDWQLHYVTPTRAHLHVYLCYQTDRKTDSLLCWRSRWLWVLLSIWYLTLSVFHETRHKIQQTELQTGCCWFCIHKKWITWTGKENPDRKGIQMMFCFHQAEEMSVTETTNTARHVWSTVKTMLPNNQEGK